MKKSESPHGARLTCDVCGRRGLRGERIGTTCGEIVIVRNASIRHVRRGKGWQTLWTGRQTTCCLGTLLSKSLMKKATTHHVETA